MTEAETKPEPLTRRTVLRTIGIIILGFAMAAVVLVILDLVFATVFTVWWDAMWNGQ